MNNYSEDIIKLNIDRAYGYMFLQNIFSEEPNGKYLNLILKNNYLNDFPFIKENLDIKRAISILIKSIEELDGNNNIGIIKWDYNRLFIGPSEIIAPPRKSAYISSNALELDEIYSKYKYMPKDTKIGMDHISNLFDFMARLSIKSIEYIEDNEKKFKIIEDQKKFFDEHILSWVYEFMEDIKNNSRTNYFIGTAFLLKGHIVAESSNLQLLSN